jgi:4-amino-4-deoxy-L-arabinose transferase-like glycosyltransferase
MRRRTRNRLLLLAGLMAAALAVGVALPWLAANGYAGAVIRENYEERRDASALFYSELEGMDALEGRVTRAMGRNPVR